MWIVCGLLIKLWNKSAVTNNRPLNEAIYLKLIQASQ